MQAIRNALARLVGDTVSREAHEAALERISALLELSANQQAEIMDQVLKMDAKQVVIETYQEDMRRTSAEVVRLRAALARMKTERDEWRDRALGYLEKMGGPKKRVLG